MTDELRIDKLVQRATTQFDSVSDSPRIDAELLMCQALDVARSYLIAHPEDVVDEHGSQRFRSLVSRRAGGEPMAYIRGTQEFWSMELMVSPDTLIPRPETELLVEHALGLIPRGQTSRVLDFGTGTGAVAIAIAKERTLAEVVATDISDAAVAVARENARQNDVAYISFRVGSWTQPVQGQTFDLVVSNPPYVRSDDDALARLQCEPQSALLAGSDGLDAIRILADECRSILRAGGTMLLEHGADQADAVADILTSNGWHEIRMRKDLAGLPRITAAVHNPPLTTGNSP